MSKEVWINGTARITSKNRYGSYVAYLDEEDIKWLNSKKIRSIKKRCN